MSRGTYLQRIARRAIQDTPGVLRPRRSMRTLSASPPDEAPSALQSPAAVSSTRLPAADPVQPRASAPVGRFPPSIAPPEIAAQPAAHATVSVSLPPPVAGVDTHAVPRRDVPSAARAVEETSAADIIQRPSRREPSAVAGDRTTEAIARTPGGARRRMPSRRNVPVAPDPFAATLAAAVRWTSSDERPTPIAPRATAHSEREIEPVARDLRETPPRDPPAGVTQAPRAEAVAATPRGPLSLPSSAASPGAASRATPAPAAERFTGIHIGSLEVQILTPPEMPTPPAARPPAASNAVLTPLARGFTSSIGMRQS